MLLLEWPRKAGAPPGGERAHVNRLVLGDHLADLLPEGLGDRVQVDPRVRWHVLGDPLRQHKAKAVFQLFRRRRQHTVAVLSARKVDGMASQRQRG